MHRPICAECHAAAPDLGNGFTTIASASPATGWRLTRTTQADGSHTVVWQCPSCWRKRRNGDGDPRPGKTSGAGAGRRRSTLPRPIR